MVECGTSSNGQNTTLIVDGKTLTAGGGNSATFSTPGTGGTWSGGLYGRNGSGQINACSNDYGKGGNGGGGDAGGYTIAISGVIVLGAVGGTGTSGCIFMTEYY